MKLGITFNGKHSSEFNAFANDIQKPILSNPRDTYEYIPGSDSTVLFNEGLEDKQITLELVVEHEPHEKQQKLREITSWLYTTEKKQLIIDDDKENFYMAKVSSSVEVKSSLRFTTLNVSFIAEPILQSVEEQTIALANGTNTINNSGTYHALPVFYIHAESTISDLKIESDHFEFTFNDTIQSGRTLVIDSNDIDIYIQDGPNKSLEADGTLPYFSVGENEITISYNGNANITVKWRKRYLY